jgi:heme-degrading monooxygenase HmoA
VYQIVWAFRPRPECRAEFEEAYGPSGGWVALFRQSPDYLGTDFLRPADGSGRYLTIDRWRSRAAYEDFRADRRAEYEALERAGEEWTMAEELLGEFVTEDDLSQNRR